MPDTPNSAGCLLKVEIDWQQYLRSLDLLWKHTPTSFYEAPFLGNGALGAAVWQRGGDRRLTVELGDTRVRDHQTHPECLMGRPRLPVGVLELHTQGEVTGVDLRLSLWDAELSGTVTTVTGTVALRAFVHATNDLLVIITEVISGEERIEWRFTPGLARSPRLDFFPAPDGLLGNPPPVAEPGRVIQDLAVGGRTVTAWQHTASAGTRTEILYATVAHTYPAMNAGEIAEKTLATAARTPLDSLIAEHRAWWHAFYPKSFLSIPDARLESFYWIQLYKMASATRREHPVLSTTGPWLIPTPWPGTWWNLNVQLEYWLINATGHWELDSLTRSLADHQQELAANVPEAYRHDSIVMTRVTQDDLVSDRVVLPGAADGNPEIGNLTWALHNAWLSYRHQMDDTVLRDVIFPLLRKAINFYLHFITRDEHGTYHLPATYSPEYGSTRDCNYDLGLLRWGCVTLLAATDHLGITDPLSGTWRDVLDHLAEPPRDPETGLWIGADLQLTSSHRHYSHLLWFYPLYLLDPTEPDNRQLLLASLSTWLGHEGALQGYTFTGSGSMYASIGDGESAARQLDTLLDRYITANTMYAESGPVIETPLSAAQTLHDMLLQSWGGLIRVFPALPRAWRDAAIHDLRTEGAFQISAMRKDGRTRFVRIKSTTGQPCTLAPGDLTAPHHIQATDPAATWKDNGDNTLTLVLPAGTEALITSEETAVPVIAPIGIPARGLAPFGVIDKALHDY
jgi:alpha-L-fucosidase 2